MAFSCIFRTFQARARALNSPAFMDFRKSFRLNPSLLAPSGPRHNHNNHHLSSSTLFRFFCDRILNERGSEPLNRETTFGDGKGEKSDPSNQGGNTILGLFGWVLCFLCIGDGLCGYGKGVEEKNKERFEEFKVKVLEPGLVSRIVVDEHLALVYLKNNTKFRSVFDRDQPIEKGVYLLGINSTESFIKELRQTQKILRLDPVPVIYFPKN